MLLFGITLNPMLQKYEKVYIIFYVFVIFIPNSMGEYWALITWKSFTYKLDVLIYVILATCLVSTVCIHHRRREHFLRLYDKIAQPGEYINETFFEMSEKLLKHRNIIIYFTMVVIGLTMSAVFPFILACFTDAQLGSAPTLLYPSSYPWTSNTPPM